VFNKRKPDELKPVAATTADAAPLPPPPEYFPTIPEFGRAAEPAPAGQPLPSSLKEYPMARSPFAPPLPATQPTPSLRAPSAAPPSPREDGQRRTLVVGRGISVQGTVQYAERLVVEGTVEAAMINGLIELSIAHGGMFKGEVEVDEAEVAGTIDGTLTARHALIVRASGRVLGTARCRRLQVEDGGQITGRIEMLGDTPALAQEETAIV
jgi:cytoskeletal protein CcmA (bactofilin family)